MATLNISTQSLTANWGGILGVVLAVWNQYSPTLSNFFTNHPHIALWASIGAMVAAFYVQATAPAKAVTPVAKA